MKVEIEIPDDYIPKDAAGIVYAIRDALDFAGIPSVITELSDSGVRREL